MQMKCIQLPVFSLILSTCFAFGSARAETNLIRPGGNDTIPPVVICQNLNLALDSAGFASLTAAEVDNGSYDNVAIDTMILSQTEFDCSNLGMNIIIITVFDLEGNSATCEASITVEDTIAPYLSCNDTILYIPDASLGGFELMDVDEACWISHTIISLGVVGLENEERSGPPPEFPWFYFDCDSLGVHELITTVIDASGNSSTCVSQISVLDTLSFAASCVGNTNLWMDSTGQVELTAEEVFYPISCDMFFGTFSLSQTNFTCADMGYTDVTLFATDTLGNTTTCTTTVRLRDGTFVLNYRDTTLYLDSLGYAVLPDPEVLVAYTSLCGIDSITYSRIRDGVNIGSGPPPTPVVTEFGCNDVDVQNKYHFRVYKNDGSTLVFNPSVTVIDTINCSSISQAYFQEYEVFLSLLPNPSNGNFKLHLESSASLGDLILRIWSIKGQLIDERKLVTNSTSFEEEFNLPLKSGVYILELVDDKTTYHKRLVIR